MDLKQKQAHLTRVVAGLDLSAPYTQHRPIRVKQPYHGLAAFDFLARYLSHISKETWSRALADGLVHCNGEVVRAEYTVRAGQRLERLYPGHREPQVATDIVLLHDDADLLIINKPAPLPVHPGGRFSRNTVTAILRQAFPEFQLRLVHRLDANTTGILVLAKHKAAAHELQQQFEKRQVAKIYLARVHGHCARTSFSCADSVEKGPLVGGMRQLGQGGEAATACRLLRHFHDATSLLEIQPSTGRTNQIRIHLQSMGLPIVGDEIYHGHETRSRRQLQEKGRLEAGFTAQTPLCLHAWKISFTHPTRHELLTIESPRPAWVEQHSRNR